MGVISKQGSRNAVIAYIGAAIGIFIWGFLLPKWMPSTGHYGLIKLLRDNSLFLGTLALLGTNRTLIRFFPTFGDSSEKKAQLLSLVVGISLIGYFLVVVPMVVFKGPILAFFGDESGLLGSYFFLFIPLILFFLATEILNSIMYCKFKTVVPTFLKDIGSRFFFLLVFFLYWFLELDYTFLINGLVISVGINLLLLFAYALKTKSLTLGFPADLLRGPEIKPILSYSFFLLLTVIGGLGVRMVDSTMILKYIDLDATGIYGMAALMTIVLQIPHRAIIVVVGPIVAKAWAEDDREELKKTNIKSTQTLFFLGGMLFCLIWAGLDDLFLLLPNDYAAAKHVFFFLGLGKIITLLGGANMEILITSKYFRFNFFYMVVFLICLVVTNLLLIPIFGVVGVALASFISEGIFALVVAGILILKFKIHPGTKELFITLILLIVGVLLSFPLLALPFHPILNIVLKSVIIGAVFLSALLYFNLSSDLNSKVNDILSKLGIAHK